MYTKGAASVAAAAAPVVFINLRRVTGWTISLHHTAARSNAFCGKDELAAKSKQVLVKF
jgi:hypothetical protein